MVRLTDESPYVGALLALVLFVAPFSFMAWRAYGKWSASRGEAEPETAFFWIALVLGAICAGITFFAARAVLLYVLTSGLQVKASAARLSPGEPIEVAVQGGARVDPATLAVRLVSEHSYYVRSGGKSYPHRDRDVEVPLARFSEAPTTIHWQGGLPPDAPATYSEGSASRKWVVEIEGRTLGLPFVRQFPIVVAAPETVGAAAGVT